MDNKTRIDVYETLCPQQMLVHKGGKIKNRGGECRHVTPKKLQSQNIFKESTGGGGVGLGGRVGVGGGQDEYERRINVFGKIQKKNYLFFFFGGGGGVGSGGQGRCEQRSEVFVKIKQKIKGGFGGRGGSGWRGVRVDVNEELKFL